MIDNYLLEYLIAFNEEGSLLKASSKLHITQPTLSRGMQKLEDELDLKIFDRNGNKISLNENGKILMDYIKDIVALNNILENKAKELKEKELQIHISMTAPGIMFYYSYFFFNNLKKYTSKITDIKSCIKEVKEGLIDVAFINEKIEDEELICERIVDEELYVCLSKEHFLSSKKEVSYKELDGQSFLLGTNLGIWDDIVKRRLSKSKFIVLDRESLDEVSKYSSIPSFVTNLSMTLVDRESKVRIPIVDDETKVTFYVVYRPAKKKIFDFIKLAR